MNISVNTGRMEIHYHAMHFVYYNKVKQLCIVDSDGFSYSSWTDVVIRQMELRHSKNELYIELELGSKFMTATGKEKLNVWEVKDDSRTVTP